MNKEERAFLEQTRAKNHRQRWTAGEIEAISAYEMTEAELKDASIVVQMAHDMTVEEIAALLGRSVEAVKVRRSKLRTDASGGH